MDECIGLECMPCGAWWPLKMAQMVWKKDFDGLMAWEKLTKIFNGLWIPFDCSKANSLQLPWWCLFADQLCSTFLEMQKCIFNFFVSWLISTLITDSLTVWLVHSLWYGFEDYLRNEVMCITCACSVFGSHHLAWFKSPRDLVRPIFVAKLESFSPPSRTASMNIVCSNLAVGMPWKSLQSSIIIPSDITTPKVMRLVTQSCPHWIYQCVLNHWKQCCTTWAGIGQQAIRYIPGQYVFSLTDSIPKIRWWNAFLQTEWQSDVVFQNQWAMHLGCCQDTGFLRVWELYHNKGQLAREF